MARSRSGRSASRKSTPVSPPKPVPSSIRSTRSSANKQVNLARDTPSKTRRTSGGSDLERSTVKRRTRANQPEPILEVVPETLDVQYPDLTAGTNENDPEDDEDRFSMMSGSTTHSAAEREALDFDELVDELSNLFSASSKLVDMLDVSDATATRALHDQLQISGSSENVRLAKLLGKFQQIRDLFGTSGYLINQSIVIQVLRKVKSWSDVGNGTWRPDAIIQLANLAQVMATLFPKHREAHGAMDPLTHLHQYFPSPFMNGTHHTGIRAKEPGRSRLITQTLSVALELRTQYVIKLLAERENDTEFDPDQITRLVFYSDDTHFRGWDIDGLQDEEGNAPEDITELIMARVTDIRKYFSQDSEEPVDFSGLDNAFPWIGFLERLSRWAHLRAGELREEIKLRGGADEIESLLRKGVNPIEEQEEPLPTFTPSRVTTQTPRSLLPAVNLMKASEKTNKRSSLDNAYRLLEREKTLLNRHKEALKLAEAVPPIETAPSNSIYDEAPIGMDDEIPADDEEPPVPTQASIASPRKTQLVKEKLAAFRRESNKENIQTGPTRRRAFIDPQENADRISFEDDEHIPSLSAKRKRASRNETVEDDDESAFETDTRRPIPKRPTRKPETPKQGARVEIRVPKPVREPRRDEDDGDAEAEFNEAMASIARSTASFHPDIPTSSALSSPPSSAIPPPSSKVQIYENVRMVSKTNLRNIRPSALAQKRKQYTADEIQRIIDLVEKYGTSWSLIKKMDTVHPQGPLLERRSQVDIKDKCRNMALDFYKNGVPLPHNFEKVALKTQDYIKIGQIRDTGH